MKKIISLALLLLLFCGCSVNKIQEESFDSIIDTVLYKDSNLFNVSFEGYKFYLPRGATVKEKKEYNLEIRDKKNTYFMYIDTIAYYYKTKFEHKEDKSLFYSKNLDNGYIDISKVKNKYFVEIMYNYSKIEAYVNEEDLGYSFLNICSMLSSISFNDSAISYRLSTHESDMSTEEFSIFKSRKDDDNFLKYVEEFDKYKDDQKDTVRDDDVIETDEGE